jgi:hypothetical protein
VPSAPGVAHNYHILDRMYQLQSKMNVGMGLALFKNQIALGPGDSITEMQEADFPGYARIPLDNDFGPPAILGNGQLQIAGKSHAFTFTAGTPQTVYGWFIRDSTDMRYSYTFPTPIQMSNGVTIYIQPLLQDWAYVTVP